MTNCAAMASFVAVKECRSCTRLRRHVCMTSLAEKSSVASWSAIGLIDALPCSERRTCEGLRVRVQAAHVVTAIQKLAGDMTFATPDLKNRRPDRNMRLKKL